MKQAYRTDWMPQNRAELCACVAVLSMQGKLSRDDEQHVADYIAFRARLATPSGHENER